MAEEGLMTLLEAMLTLAAREARRPKPPPVKPGGYSEDSFLDLTEDEKEEFSCSICYQILKEAMQCSNQHKFCHSCLVVWSTTGLYANRIRCPVCRTDGIYFRDTDLDDRIGEKNVKCHLESCKWSGKCKNLLSHRHTTYSDEKPENSTSSVPSIPRLSQASPQLPPSSSSRFNGTGLSIRDLRENLRENVQASQTPRAPTVLSRASVTPSSLSTTSQETITELPTQTTSRPIQTGPRRIPPVRSSTNNRIIFNHSNLNRDGNNNLQQSRAASVAPNESAESQISSSTANVDTAASAAAPIPITGGFTPRPPSAPRNPSNPVNTRRLPRITNPPPPRGRRYNPPEAPALGISSSPAPRPSGVSENLGEIRDRLQESRSRLDNLMTSFAGEVDRNRQEMAEFQQQRERQRREQLEEVRELGQRLGQVASELRRLLGHRRGLGAPALGDSDTD